MKYTSLPDLVQAILETPGDFILATWSASIRNTPSPDAEMLKARCKPVVIKEQLVFQIETFTKKQSFTKNVFPDVLEEVFLELSTRFSELFVRFTQRELHIRFTEGKMHTTSKAILPVEQVLDHNRAKKYLLQDGVPVDFLIALGIQNSEGKVIRQKYDKFKQIVHFLELLSSLFAQFKTQTHITLLDLACGKAYLTFALYYFLTNAGHTVTLYGVDLKEEVIAKCQSLKERLGYTGMQFIAGSIENFHIDAADIVVSLHACDIATDYVLAKAIALHAKAIVVAPCCQHEVAAQFKKQACPLIFRHGILKERYGALVTDALRAELLEQFGYKTDLVEFIDPDHTPKNLLIRAVLKQSRAAPDLSKYYDLTRELAITTTLEKLLLPEKNSP